MNNGRMAARDMPEISNASLSAFMPFSSRSNDDGHYDRYAPITGPLDAIWDHDGAEADEDDELEDEEELEEEDDEDRGSVSDITGDAEVPEEAQAGIRAFNERYAQARAHRRFSRLKIEAEHSERMNNQPLEGPEKLPWDDIYGSNEDVYNPYKPYTSKEYVAQEVAAGRIQALNGPCHHQEMPRNRTTIVGKELNNQSISTKSGLERYLANATAWTLDDQRAFPGIEPERMLPLIERDLRVVSKNSSLARTPRFNRVSSRFSEPLPLDDTISDIPRRSTRRRPLDLSLSGPVGAERSSSTAVPANDNVPRSRKRKSALTLATREVVPATTPSQGEVSRRPSRKRRRSTVSPQDEIPPPSLPTLTPRRRARKTPQSTNLSQTDEPETRPSSGRRASTGTSNAPGSSHIRAEAPIAINALVDALTAPFASSQVGRSEYVPPLDRLPEALRQRVLEQLRGPDVNPSMKQNLLLLPPLPYYRTRWLVFTSELIPHNFDAQKRRKLLDILRDKAPYLPACTSATPGKPRIQYHLNYGRQAYNSPSPRTTLTMNSQGKSPPELPTEIFENIARYCSHDTLKRMRLVNRDFERKLSNRVFHAAVVPFNLGIYGMIVHDDPAKEVVNIKGKGKAGEYPPLQNFSAKEVDEGMKIFQAWGGNVRKFAMAFEVDEDDLCNPPKKGKFEHHKTFWGSYKWPHPFYSRYEVVEGLEKKADEFRCMSLALSHFKEARELGLSLDSGLGWIAGPDISDRAKLFKEKPTIFGHSHPDNDVDARKEWDRKLYELGLFHKKYHIDGENICTAKGPLHTNQYDCYECIVHLNVNVFSISFQDSSNDHDFYKDTLIFQGVNLAAIPPPQSSTLSDIRNLEHETKESSFKTAALVPNNLTTAQKEWLLETEWAQRAFLSSYCMALTDNSQTFENVKCLLISKLSSRYIVALQHDDFWKALPNLNSLTIKVSADFRDIQKTDSGVVEAPDIMPSKAATQFHKLVEEHLASNAGIKTLKLGYFGGGERQEGIFGRNQHVLPAPLNDFSNHSNHVEPKVLRLPYVEHLTLTNSWVAPAMLVSFVSPKATPEMRTLTLDSVSLTTHYSGNTKEPNPLENGVVDTPYGLPRNFDPKLGNLWANRGYTPDPDCKSSPNHWLVTGGRVGSWREVIDSITPGPTIGLLRYAYQHTDVAPKMRKSSLERINFISCGYVRLHDQEGLDQAGIGHVTIRPSMPCLEKRAMDLMPVIMHRNSDRLLGQIVPSLDEEELIIFKECFPMTIGWGDDPTKNHNHEDGQPTGGTGRFSGHVEKLIFAEDMDCH